MGGSEEGILMLEPIMLTSSLGILIPSLAEPNLLHRSSDESTVSPPEHESLPFLTHTCSPVTVSPFCVRLPSAGTLVVPSQSPITCVSTDG